MSHCRKYTSARECQSCFQDKTSKAKTKEKDKHCTQLEAETICSDVDKIKKSDCFPVISNICLTIFLYTFMLVVNKSVCLVRVEVSGAKCWLKIQYSQKSKLPQYLNMDHVFLSCMNGPSQYTHVFKFSYPSTALSSS